MKCIKKEKRKTKNPDRTFLKPFGRFPRPPFIAWLETLQGRPSRTQQLEKLVVVRCVVLSCSRQDIASTRIRWPPPLASSAAVVVQRAWTPYSWVPCISPHCPYVVVSCRRTSRTRHFLLYVPAQLLHSPYTSLVMQHAKIYVFTRIHKKAECSL